MLTKVAVKNCGILEAKLRRKTSSMELRPPSLIIALSLFSGMTTIFSNVLYSSTSVSLCGDLIICIGFSFHCLSKRDLLPIFSILSSGKNAIWPIPFAVFLPISVPI